jgi:hypothetical protein
MTWRAVWCLLIGVAAGGGAASLSGAEPTPAELLPPTVVAYAEMSDPPRFLRVLLDHPLRQRLERLEEYQAALRRKETLAALGVLEFVETRLGMTWRQAVESLTAKGVAFAVDLPTQGMAILVRAESEPALRRLCDELIALGREDARNKGRKDPYRQHDYRGQTVYQVDKGVFAAIGEWLVIVNNAELAQGIFNRLLDGPGECLSSQPRFTEARSARSPEAAVWLWADVAALREQAARDGKPFGRQTDNPVAELLVGGILDVVQHAPWLTGTLRLSPHEAALTWQTPFQREWISEPRQYSLAPADEQTPVGLVAGEEWLFSLRTYRDLSAMWLHAADLFPENVVDKLAEADSNLTTLFAGKDFGEDILGALGPVMQLVAAEQTFPDESTAPIVKLPAFALVFTLRDPDVSRRELRRTFQSLIGFTNIVGAMSGQPQLELDMASGEGFDLVVARYVPPANRDPQAPLPIQFNFSPTVAFSGARFILASTEGLARQLAAAPSPPPGEAAAGVNTSLHLNFGALRRILAANRSHLITQNMLQEGHSREEAERQVSLGLALLDHLLDFTLKLRQSEHSWELDLRLRLRDTP